MVPSNGPVFIIATPGDVHALAVAARIEARDQKVVIWDSGRLPATDHLTLHWTKSGARNVILDSTACGTVDLSQVRSIWWRRPAAPTIPSSVDGDYIRAYCRSETDQLFRGTLAGLKVPIYNDPDAEEKAARKPYHLSVASSIGMRVPETLMSCSAERVLEYCAASGPVIFKAFRAPAGSLVSTREYEEAVSDKLSLLNNAPSIFQQKVAPFRDVRVSVIGNKILSGVSQSRLIDWRVDAHLTWAAHELPPEVKRLSFTLVRKLGLTIGHLDFRLTPEGEYVFFEINPSGQFLFLEVDDPEIEVTSAMADLFLGLDAQADRSGQ